MVIILRSRGYLLIMKVRIVGGMRFRMNLMFGMKLVMKVRIV